MGLDIELFWRVTPRLMFLAIEAACRRLQNEHDGRAWLAWNIAALQRHKRLPPLKALMIKRRNRRPQTWKEQLQLIRMITAAHGGKS